MRQTLTYNPLHFVQIGAVYGYTYAKDEAAAQTASVAPIVTSAKPNDPLEELFGRYDHNPRWAEFPNWLRQYRSEMNERERELSHQG